MIMEYRKTPENIIELMLENGYIIKNNGFIYRNSRKLTGGIDKKGYVRYTISIKGIAYTLKGHRIIAMRFLENPNNKPQVNHINGIKTDNSVKNLEWCNNSENQIHALRNNLKRLDNFLLKAKEATSKLILDKETGIFYFGTNEASIAKNINRNTLRSKLNGNQQNNTSLIYI